MILRISVMPPAAFGVGLEHGRRAALDQLALICQRV